jgi:predicted ribosomally synthesized peptide with SipW-like signal peptide
METMKKIGLLLLALVIALGALGVGYAKWTDSVNIVGQVNTGTLILGIADAGTNDSGTTADPNCLPGVNTEGKNVASAESTNDGSQVTACAGYYKSITETFKNVYPYYSPGVKIQIASCGTVPIKIEDVVAYYVAPTTLPSPTTQAVDLMPWMGLTWTVYDENGLIVANGSGTIYNLRDGLKGLQVGSGTGPLTLWLKFCFNEYKIGTTDQSPANLLPELAAASYNITITGSQWNEVAIPEPAPISPVPSPLVSW